MGTKTISITDTAYLRLAREKQPGESFTDVILRLTRGRSLRELPDLVAPDEARALTEAVLASREERAARRRKRTTGGT